jgi:hypothetical protein
MGSLRFGETMGYRHVIRTTHDKTIANQNTVREDYSHDGDAWSREFIF